MTQWMPTDADIACADMIIGVGIATVCMAGWVAVEDWRRHRKPVPTNKNSKNIPEDEK